MQVINRRTLHKWREQHRNASGALEAWAFKVNLSRWENPAELIQEFPTARNLGGPEDRAIFKIHGNRYRLIIGIDYRLKRVFCKFFGTHAEYDEVDALAVDQH